MESGVEKGTRRGDDGVLEGGQETACEVLFFFFFYISVSIGILMYTLSCMATYSQEYIRIDKLANNTQWIEHIQNE